MSKRDKSGGDGVDQGDKNRCRNCTLVSHGDGTYSNYQCEMACFETSDGAGQTYPSCVFHCDQHQVRTHLGDDASEQAVAAEMRRILQSRDVIIEALFSGEVSERDYPGLGSQQHPLTGLESSRLEISGVSRSDPLVVADAQIDGPVFITGCEFDDLEIHLTKGATLTIVASTIKTLRVKTEDPDKLAVWINEANISALYIEAMAFGKFGVKNSKIERLTLDGPAGFDGNLVVTGSEIYVSGGDFSQAKISVCDHVTFSRTKLAGCSYLSRRHDPWRRLKQKYNQNSSLMAVVLFAAFAFPLITDFAFWSAVHELQGVLAVILGEGGSEVASLATCLAPECRETNALLLSLGANKGTYYILMTLALLILNILRILQVQEVALLRELEAQTGYYPEYGTILPRRIFKSGPESEAFGEWRLSYRHLILVDRVISALIYLSIFAFALTLYGMATKTVSVPIN